MYYVCMLYSTRDEIDTDLNLTGIIYVNRTLVL